MNELMIEKMRKRREETEKRGNSANDVGRSKLLIFHPKENQSKMDRFQMQQNPQSFANQLKMIQQQICGKEKERQRDRQNKDRKNKLVQCGCEEQM